MKKILFSSYFCVAFLLLLGSRIPFFATTATKPVTCTEAAVIRTVRVQGVMLDFYCGVPDDQQALIAELVKAALHAGPPGPAPGGEVSAFSSLDQGVDAEYSLLRARGSAPDVEQLRLAWQDKGLLGQTFPSAVFLYVGHPAWSALGRLTVLHEMHHILQYDLVGSDRRLPLWLLEGGAEYFATVELADLDLPLPRRESSSYHCDYPLHSLEQATAGIPLACAYVEGRQAVSLLVDEYGSDRYYGLLRAMGSGPAFPSAFAEAYPLPLSAFYRRVDAALRPDSAWTHLLDRILAPSP